MDSQKKQIKQAPKPLGQCVGRLALSVSSSLHTRCESVEKSKRAGGHKRTPPVEKVGLPSVRLSTRHRASGVQARRRTNGYT